MLVTCIAALASTLLAAGPSDRKPEGLGLDLSGKSTPATNTAPEAGAVVLVPWGKGTKIDTAAYARLVGALETELPGRTVSADNALNAVRDNKLTVAALKTPDGIYKLSHSVWAFRAVTVDFFGRDVLLEVFDTDQKTRLARKVVKGAASLGKVEAAKVAHAAAKAAAGPAEVATAPGGTGEKNTEPEVLQPLVPDVAESVQPGQSVSDADLEEAMRAPVAPPPKPKPYKPPFLFASVGAGPGFGTLSTRGQASSQLSTVKIDTVPDIAVYLAFLPIHLADARVANAGWSDLLVEGTFRRAFAHATSETSSGSVRCTLDDDELMVRVGWRYRFKGDYAPGIGLGAGWGQDRLRFNCALPVASVSYRAIDVNLRYYQPLYSRKVWLELVAGPRFALAGTDTTHSPGPGWGGDLWAYWQILPYFFARGGVRVATTRLEEQQSLGVSTLRASVALELGVSL